jgi:hypothetical protein
MVAHDIALHRPALSGYAAGGLSISTSIVCPSRD